MKDKKIFVTGGTGFLGSYLLRYLVQRGYSKIRALRRKDSDMSLVEEIADHIEWLEGDLLDICFLEEALEGMEEIYHCAALVSYHPKHIEKMMEVNQSGTANLVNALLHLGRGRLLHVSSIAAIGRSKEQLQVSEKTKWIKSPLTSNYAISKFLAEQEVWRGIAEGLEAVIINPSVILGSGFWDRGSPSFFTKVKRGQRFYPLGGSGFVDVRDVARMSITLMESDIRSERFIANGANRSFKKFFGLMARLLSAPAPSIPAGALLSNLAWRVESLRSRLTGSTPILTRETARLAAYVFTYDNSKSLEQLDFSYIPIDETIAATARQFRESKGKTPRVLPLA